MAKTYTSLFENVSTANTQAVTTAESLTPVAGRLYEVWVSFHRGSSLSGLTATATHAGGLTLTLITSVLSQKGSVVAGTMLCLFQGVGTGGESAGTITATCNLGSDTNMEGHQYHVVEVTNVDTTTPIPQFASNQENNTTDGNITATLGSGFVAATSGVTSCCVGSNTTTIGTVPTGWTILGSGVSQSGGPTTSMTVAYLDSNDSTADWSGYGTGGAEDLAAIIAEVAEAAGGGGGTSSSSTVTVAQVRKIQVVPA